MGIKAPPSQRNDVLILTSQFQFKGQLETVGPPGNYINDPNRQNLSLHDVRIEPLISGSPLGSVARPHVVILKSHITFLYFTSAEAREAIKTFTRRELLMSYTPIAVCRGYFHMPTEAKLTDFLSVVPGDLIPITDAQLFPLVDLPAPFPAEPEMLLTGRSYLLFYHPA